MNFFIIKYEAETSAETYSENLSKHALYELFARIPPNNSTSLDKSAIIIKTVIFSELNFSHLQMVNNYFNGFYQAVWLLKFHPLGNGPTFNGP